eukprot:7386228-Prymnesium_polylepis.1
MRFQWRSCSAGLPRSVITGIASLKSSTLSLNMETTASCWPLGPRPARQGGARQGGARSHATSGGSRGGGGGRDGGQLSCSVTPGQPPLEAGRTHGSLEGPPNPHWRPDGRTGNWRDPRPEGRWRPLAAVGSTRGGP